MLAQLLPPPIRSAEAFDDGAPAFVFPEEAALVAASSQKRRQEFATTRSCARRALAELGVVAAPILPGQGRAPQWPDGIVGSLTHCRGYRGAAVARTSDVTTIGIDAEPALPLPTGVFGLVTTPAERDHLTDLGTRAASHASQDVPWDRLLFCVKEAAYKAWYPLTREWLAFADAEATLGLDGTFSVRQLTVGEQPADPILTRLDGRWLAHEGLLLAAIAASR